MDQGARLDSFQPVPDTLGDDVGIAGFQQHRRLDPRRLLVTVVKDQRHRSGDDQQEFVTVGMNLAGMRSGPLQVGDRSDRVPLDPLWRPRRGGPDRDGPVASDVRDLPLEPDRMPRLCRRQGSAPRPTLKRARERTRSVSARGHRGREAPAPLPRVRRLVGQEIAPTERGPLRRRSSGYIVGLEIACEGDHVRRRDVCRGVP